MKTAHLHQLEAWAQQELHAQRAFAATLETYERAIVRGDVDAMSRGAHDVQSHIELAVERETRRGALLGAIAADLRVGARALTLGGLCVRAGERAQRLSETRAELLDATRRCNELGRRVLILARAQQQVLAEALEAAFGKGEAVLQGQGRLVDTQV